jgi:hypothetical protein
MDPDKGTKPVTRRSKNDSVAVQEQNAKKAACKRQMKEKFKSYDYFGQQVGFTWNGEDQYKTSFGATVSIILRVVLLAYAINRLYEIIVRKDPVVTVTSLVHSLEESANVGYRPQDTGFDFSFGLINNLDPTYGFFTLKLIEQ